MRQELQETLQKYNTLIGYDQLESLLERSTNSEHLASLSNDDLKYLKDEADVLYRFFYQLQKTTKLLCNSVYGGLGTPSLRYFNHVVADDITAEGRDVCQLMGKAGDHYFHSIWHNDFEWHQELNEKFPSFFINVEIGKPLKQIHKTTTQYQDTDSVFLVFSHLFESLGLDPYTLPTKETVEFLVYFMKNKMDPYYDNVLTRYITGRNGENHMIFELEAIGGFGIWVAKKKYVMASLWQDGKYIAEKGYLKVTGLEIKQKAASKRVKEVLKTFVNTIFVRRGKIDAQTFFAMCNHVKKSLADSTFDELAKSTKVGDYEKYVINDTDKVEVESGCPVVIRGAAKHNMLLKQAGLLSTYPLLKADMFVKWYYDETGNPFTYTAEYGCPVEFAPPISIEVQLEKLVFNPIKRLVDGLIDGNLDDMGQEKVQMGFNKLLSKLK